ncbi:MAG: galactose mutarotase [Lachnospiraceae bacterium]|nr:galactose mutarotase [Lachnospiraceae bacterium]
MGITKKEFGLTKDSRSANLYTLANDNGMKVVFSDYGAVIVSIYVPDRNGNVCDIALGYDTIAAYERNAPGYGSFIGRHANRIQDARFELNGVVYQLEVNDGKNNLHSASHSYNKYFYDVRHYAADGDMSIEFSRLSPDMEQGFPGNLDVSVTYTLTKENELVIEYYARSDKDTIVNFTNHSYFNLSGHASGSVLNHIVSINADAFTPTTDDLIPTGEIRSVAGTPMDFRKAKTIGRDINADYLPLKQAGGYDHNYVLTKKTNGQVEKAADLYDEKSGRFMEVYTDLPGMQFYTGNFIPGNELGKDNYIYKKRDGVCFETQYFPNSCNIKNFPSCRLGASQEYDSVTIYKFSVK